MYNITHIINAIYAEKGENIVLGITLEEINPREFTGLESYPYYVNPYVFLP